MGRLSREVTVTPPRAGGDSDEATVTVWTRKYSSMCGFNFTAGGRYFVFAKYGQTTICTPTAQYADDIAADYYKAFGEGREPAKLKPVKPKPLAEKPPR